MFWMQCKNTCSTPDILYDRSFSTFWHFSSKSFNFRFDSLHKPEFCLNWFHFDACRKTEAVIRLFYSFRFKSIASSKRTNERIHICKLWPHLFLNCECMCVSSTSNTMFNFIFFSAWFLSWSLCHFSLASFFTSKMHNKSFTGSLKLFVLRAWLTKKIPMYSQEIWDSYERERTYSFKMKKQKQILVLVVSFMKIWNVKFWHFLNKAKLRGFK